MGTHSHRCVVIACLLLAGCDYKPFQEPPEKPWQLAPVTHVCTAPEMTKAQAEAAWCNANTSYFATYCYGSAILRNCAPRTP